MPTEIAGTAAAPFGTAEATPLAAALGPVTLREKLFYGLGEVGEAVKTAALETFLFFYYIQVLGLQGSLAGLALFIALMVDGVSDPLIGSWSDRTRSKLGRRHPYLYMAPIPLAIGIVLLFSPPHGLSQAMLFLWLTSFAIISRFAMALYFVPHMALGADLSDNFDERVSIGGYRTGFSYAGRLLALGGAFSLFFVATAAFPRGQLNPAAYTPFSLFCAAAVIIAVFCSALGTQARARRIAVRPLAEGPRTPVWRTVIQALRLTSFRSMFLSLLLFYIFNGTQAALMLHMGTFYWQLTPGQLQWTFYASTIGFIPGVFFVRRVAARLDKKPAYIVGVLLSCSTVCMPVLLRLAGVFPENGSPMLVPMLCAFNFIYGVFGSVPVTLSSAMLADVADDYDLARGVRAEGLFFGAVAFSRKASTGIGGALAGVLLDLIAFPRKAVVGHVDAPTLTHLAILYGPVLLVILCSGLFILAPYDLSRQRHEAILLALKDRPGEA
jgi:GPH family glycoside/pentoside/hexuronide:cation symporter